MKTSQSIFKQHIIFYSLILLFAGCGSGTKNDKIEFTESDATAKKDEVLSTLRGSQITKQLRSSGEFFHREALNDISNTNRYLKLSKAVAAANLGVYMSDLGYLVEFENIDASRYFDACLLLSEYAGIEKQFSNAVDLRFQEIISGNEAIQQSMNLVFKNVENESEGEEFKKLHAAALTGYYFEELYHLVTIVKWYEDKSLADTTTHVVRSAIHTILNQKEEINNLVGYYDHIKIQSKGIPLYQDLLRLQKLYQGAEVDQMLNDSNLNVILHNKNAQDIFNSIIIIRDGIINF
jgi:hypothetical protein